MIQDFKGWTRRDGAPFTTLLVASLSLTTLYFFSSNFRHLEFLGYAGYGFRLPWTLLTYPWAYLMASGTGLIGFIFLMIWLYWIGKSVERDISTSRMIVVWVAVTLLGAICNMIGVAITRTNSVLLGPVIPIAALSIIWCTRNPNATIHIYMIIPVAARWLGWIVVVLTALLFGSHTPLIGLCDCIPLGVAFLFAANLIPGVSYGPGKLYQSRQKQATTRGQVMYDQAYFDEVKRRETERAEQERLRKLLGED